MTNNINISAKEQAAKIFLQLLTFFAPCRADDPDNINFSTWQLKEFFKPFVVIEKKEIIKILLAKGYNFKISNKSFIWSIKLLHAPASPFEFSNN